MCSLMGMRAKFGGQGLVGGSVSLGLFLMNRYFLLFLLFSIFILFFFLVAVSVAYILL